jgi:hypothetical protein
MSDQNRIVRPVLSAHGQDGQRKQWEQKRVRDGEDAGRADRPRRAEASETTWPTICLAKNRPRSFARSPN